MPEASKKGKKKKVSKSSSSTESSSSSSPSEKKKKKKKKSTKKKHKSDKKAKTKKSTKERSKGAELNGASIGVAAAAASAGDGGEALVWDRLAITRRDFRTIDDGCLLNDSVIDFFLRLVHRCLAPRTDVHVFSCQFFTRLKAGGATSGEVGWENVKGWTKQTTLFAHSYAVVPINSETHWWLAVLRFRAANGQIKPSVVWLDSLPGPAERYSSALNYLRGYLRREWAERPARGREEVMSDKQQSKTENIQIDLEATGPCNEPGVVLDVSGLEAGVAENVPEQGNGTDCGVFLIENVLRLLGGADRLLGLGRAASAILWCDQSCATQRRSDFRRSLDHLEWAITCGGAKRARSVSVPDLLDRRPELASWLRDAWGVSASRDQSTAEVDGEDKAAIERGRSACNGIWVYDEAGLDPDRQGDLAGEIDNKGLKGATIASTRPIIMVSSNKFKMSIDREYFGRIDGDKIIWDDGEVWKKLPEDDDSSGASDDSSEARPQKKRKS